ncbi:MAG: hypothetical protein Q9187_003752 [Circinaria calcarea]
MKTSPYFDQILFYNQSPATDQSYEEKSSKLFQVDKDCSFVEIYIQPPASGHLRFGTRPSHSKWDLIPEAEAGSTCSSPREPELAIDQSHYLRSDPPRYVGAPGLKLHEISDPKELRQIAENVHQQSSTWVLIAASTSAQLHLDRYIKSSDSLATLNPFEIHLIILDTALANWRPYIVDLSEKITEQSDRILVASIDERSVVNSLDSEKRQELKDFQDQVVSIIVVLDSTLDTIASMIEKHRQFCRDFDGPLKDLTDIELEPIQLALREKQQEAHLSKKKVEALHTKIQGTISLLSDILSLGSGYSLQRLAEEARKDNVAMRGLTEKSTQDAAAVKVLTVITLVYLPATVNFFSTQFVKQQTEGQLTKVVVLSNAWLFAAISVPLTAGTLFTWWLLVRFQAGQMLPITWKECARKVISKVYRNQRTHSLEIVEELGFRGLGHTEGRSRRALNRDPDMAQSRAPVAWG